MSAPDDQQGSGGHGEPRAKLGGALVERREQLPAIALPPTSLAFEIDSDSKSLREYWAIIVKRRWTVLTFLFITVIAVVMATFLMTKVYRASLTLQIERQESKVVAYQNVTPSENAADTKDFYQTQYELLRSRALAQRVIETLNLEEDPFFKRRTSKGILTVLLADKGEEKSEQQLQDASKDVEVRRVNLFLKQLTIDPVRNSRLVKIHFEGPDPQLSARVANAIASAFINLSLERRMDASSYAKTFLQERLQQIRVKLEDSERELNAFAKAEEIVRADEKQVSPDAQVLQEFTGALAKVQQERIKAEALYRQMTNDGSAGLSAVLENRVIQEYKARKAKLETDYQEGLKIYKPGYPRMLQIEGQIAEMQAKIEEEVALTRAAAKASYDATRSAEAEIGAKLQEAKRAVLAMQDRSIQYNILKREVDTNRQLYEGLLQRLKEVGVAGGIGVNNISVVDPAEVPLLPYKPDLVVNTLIAVFLGVLGGIGLALLFEHLDDTLKHPEELEKLLHLPVLGVVPMVRNASADAADLAVRESENLRSHFSEAYRSLRTGLQFSTATGAPKVLMITSSSVGEGKSTSAVALAIQFAQAGKSVLLVDADLRKASLHRKLGIENSVGLTNYLAGDAQPVAITRPTHIPKLFVIPSGPLPPNPAELVSSSKMVSLMSLAVERFDQVIIDGPPVLGLADAPLLGSIAAATMLVVEAGNTRREFARSAVRRLRDTRTHLVGCAMTKVEPRSGSYGYYQSYYYYQYGDPEKRESGPAVA